MCLDCGQDFRRRGLACSPLAETALVVGQFGALLGCAVTPAVTLVCLLGGGVSALLWGPLAFLMELALYVVLTRVKDVGRPRA